MSIEFSAGLSTQYQPTINFVENSPQRIPRIDLNTASITNLQRLPGIGVASARKIVAVRKKKGFTHVYDLLTANLVSRTTFEQIHKMVSANGNETPYIYNVLTQPEHVLYHKSFQLNVPFDDSISGVRLVRLEANSISHSLDLTREVTTAERRRGRFTFKMPAMEAGVMNVQVSLYDNDGNKDYLARTLPIFHNPPDVIFYPSKRSLRLSNGAALRKSDGNFHCDSNFYFFNGTSSSVTLNRNMTWRIFSQGGSVLASGTYDWGNNILLAPWDISTGWWGNFTFGFNNTVGKRLRAREWIRTEFQFTQTNGGGLVTDALTWRALLGPNVSLIRVGEEKFTNAEKTIIYNALRSSVSSIYQQQDLDIGTIGNSFITVAEASRYVEINSNSEAEDLTSDWSSGWKDSIDLFIVRSYVGDVAGLAPPPPGPCDKDAKGMNGCVVELQSSQQQLGVIMAHELGHYLGLGHTSAANNLLNPVVNTNTTLLSTNQGNTMKRHCFIRFLG